MNSIKDTESDPCALAEVCLISELKGANFSLLDSEVNPSTLWFRAD